MGEQGPRTPVVPLIGPPPAGEWARRVRPGARAARPRLARPAPLCAAPPGPHLAPPPCPAPPQSRLPSFTERFTQSVPLTAHPRHCAQARAVGRLWGAGVGEHGRGSRDRCGTVHLPKAMAIAPPALPPAPCPPNPAGTTSPRTLKAEIKHTAAGGPSTPLAPAPALPPALPCPSPVCGPAPTLPLHAALPPSPPSSLPPTEQAAPQCGPRGPSHHRGDAGACDRQPGCAMGGAAPVAGRGWD